MSGITIHGSKNKATAKILSALCSYTFEQEYGEMRSFTSEEKRIINEAKKVLGKHV